MLASSGIWHFEAHYCQHIGCGNTTNDKIIKSGDSDFSLVKDKKKKTKNGVKEQKL